MILNQTDFQQKYDEGSLRLCFIGMSNIGKSYCSQLLETHFNFDRYEVDGEIQKQIGADGMNDASSWMGYPFESKYQANEKSYLSLEVEKTELDLSEKSGNLVMDTTGSVIYLNPKVRAYLEQNYLIVSFDVSQSMIDDMMGEFFRSPKTVVWGNAFNQKENEQGMDALRRCYPGLLEDRITRYRALADVTIPGEFSRIKGLQADRLFEVLKLSLPK